MRSFTLVPLESLATAAAGRIKPCLLFLKSLVVLVTIVRLSIDVSLKNSSRNPELDCACVICKAQMQNNDSVEQRRFTVDVFRVYKEAISRTGNLDRLSADC